MIWKSIFAGIIAACLSGPSWALTDEETKLKEFGTLAGSEVSFSLGDNAGDLQKRQLPPLGSFPHVS